MVQIETLDAAIAQDPNPFLDVINIFKEGLILPPNSELNIDPFSPEQGEEVAASKQREAIIADAGQKGGISNDKKANIDITDIEANFQISAADMPNISDDELLADGMKGLAAQLKIAETLEPLPENTKESFVDKVNNRGDTGNGRYS